MMTDRETMTTEFTNLVDLASERLGGAVLHANDDFFAPKENLLKASAPVWREGLYTERGKWMGGSRAAEGRRALTGASSASGSRGASAASSWTRASSAATSPKAARSKPA